MLMEHLRFFKIITDGTFLKIVQLAQGGHFNTGGAPDPPSNYEPRLAPNEPRQAPIRPD